MDSNLGTLAFFEDVGPQADVVGVGHYLACVALLHLFVT